MNVLTYGKVFALSVMLMSGVVKPNTNAFNSSILLGSSTITSFVLHKAVQYLYEKSHLDDHMDGAIIGSLIGASGSWIVSELIKTCCFKKNSYTLKELLAVLGGTMAGNTAALCIEKKDQGS